jgi:DNA-binding transcriptional LysR family regulator
MNFTLNQLRIFVSIARHNSITKAAEELHLTQPAVSIQLKKLQEQFEFPLTEIINKRLFLTDFGKEIAKAAEGILTEAENITYKSHDYKKELYGHLKISIVSTGKYIMPYFLSGFLKKHPSVTVTMDVTNKSRVIQNLENNEVDFSLVSILPGNLRLNKVELLENKLLLVGNKETLRQVKEPATLFKEMPLLLREQGSGTRQTTEKFLARKKLTIHKKMELTSNEAVKQAVLAGMGYSIMPLIGIKNELEQGLLQVIPLRGLPIKTTWSLIWLKEKKISPVADAYLEYLRSEKEQICNIHFAQSLTG